jgi:hypothetical protein
MKSFEYVPCKIQLDFDQEDISRYLNISATMPSDVSIADGNTLDSHHGLIKFYSFFIDTVNWYHPLPGLDLSHVYLLWVIDSIANGFVCEIGKESELESTKLGMINADENSPLKSLFAMMTQIIGFMLCFGRLLLKEMILY